MKPMEIVGIGANVHDTLITVTNYPTEDTKQAATGQKSCGGGPCATGLVAAAKLGASCAYLGQVADSPSGSFLRSDFERFGVDTELMEAKAGYTQFSSYVLLCTDTASRTCVFDRGNLPPFAPTQAHLDAVASAKVLMVDGNELSAAIEGAKYARAHGVDVLYDAGGRYPGIEGLLPYADYLIPSEEFALGITGAATAEEAAKLLYEKYQPKAVVITQGKQGGVWYQGEEVHAYPAFLVEAVDSNGSGDVFHGAFAFALTRGYSVEKACVFSSAVSALKCTKIGARDGVPYYKEVMEFLKQRKDGYNHAIFEENLE